MQNPRMARRPDSEKPEIFMQKDLDEPRHNLAHRSIEAVRRYYERAQRARERAMQTAICRCLRWAK